MTIWLFIGLLIICILFACILQSRFYNSIQNIFRSNATSNTIATTTPRVWSSNLEKDTIANTDWRRVFATGHNIQVVGMSVPSGESLGLEVHPDNDQFFRVEKGSAVLHVENDTMSRDINLRDGDAALVPKGTKHNITNTGPGVLSMYTIYGPPHHPNDRVDHTHLDELMR